jgi:pre-rRNA-processing protein TSR1
MAILDVVKVADIIIFAVDANVSNIIDVVDEFGHLVLSAIRALGCPETMCCIGGLSIPMDLSGAARTQMNDVKKGIIRYLQSLISNDTKVCDTIDFIQLARYICNLSPKEIGWRNNRSYLVSNEVQAQPDPAAPGKVCIRIGGYLRGKPMNVNSLAHIVGVGTGRIVDVTVATGSGPFDKAESRRKSGKISVSPTTLPSNPAVQDPLELECQVTDIGGEQTWPTEDEMGGQDIDDGAGRNRRHVPTTIPAGMSSYQADWYVDEEGEYDDGNDSEEGEEGEEGDNEHMVDGTTKDNTDHDTGKHVKFDGMEEDDDEDETFTMDGSLLNATGTAAIEEKRRLRALAKEDDEFPDEVDTPYDMSARKRFARYRALQSFRTSPWHPKENLPLDYARIYQFENFSGAQKRVLTEGKLAESLQHTNLLKGKSGGSAKHGDSMSVTDADDSAVDNSGVVPGTNNTYVCSDQYVFITIGSLPSEVLTRLQTVGYVTMFSILQHENKLSVVNYNVTRCATYADPIKSKDPMIMHTGFRSFLAKPIYSESNINSDKHKLERFFKSDKFTVASVYGPVTFLPCPLLMFKKLDNGRLVLAATGSLHSVDPDRIILKKIILTGLPMRVRKRYAVVKHLFYDPQDVRWFKPAELYTKRGLRGHIREPVGTHGLLKAQFSAPITQDDTVMLILYKRIYPKIPAEGIQMF